MGLELRKAMSKVEHNFNASETDLRTYAESSLNMLNSWTSESCQLKLGAGDHAVVAFGKLIDAKERLDRRDQLIAVIKSERNLCGKAGSDLANVLQDVFKTGGMIEVDSFLQLLNSELAKDLVKISHREDLRLSSSVNSFAQQEHLALKARTVILQLRTESGSSNKLIALLANS